MVARVPSPDPQDVPSPTKSELMDECKSMVEAFRRRRQRVIDAEMREVSGNGSESDASTREPVKAELPTPRGGAFSWHSVPLDLAPLDTEP